MYTLTFYLILFSELFKKLVIDIHKGSPTGPHSFYLIKFLRGCQNKHLKCWLS